MASLEQKTRPRPWNAHATDVFGRNLLKRREAALLNCLLCHQGLPVTYRTICDWLWGDDPDGGPLTAYARVQALISWLRFCGWPIETVYGRGYCIPWQRP